MISTDTTSHPLTDQMNVEHLRQHFFAGNFHTNILILMAREKMTHDLRKNLSLELKERVNFLEYLPLRFYPTIEGHAYTTC